MKLAIFGIGTTELLIILAIMALVFGASRLPMLGKGLGQGIRGFREGLRGPDEGANVQNADKDAPKEADQGGEGKSGPEASGKP